MTPDLTPIESGLMWTLRKENIALPHIGQEIVNQLREVKKNF